MTESQTEPIAPTPSEESIQDVVTIIDLIVAAAVRDVLSLMDNKGDVKATVAATAMHKLGSVIKIELGLKLPANENQDAIEPLIYIP